MRTRAVLFDLDGTLVDSAITIQKILNRMRIKAGKIPLDIDSYRKWVSLGAESLISNSLEISIDEVTFYLEEFRNFYAELNTDSNSLYPGAFTVIDRLSQMGLSLGICSNKPKHLCDKVLRDLELNSYFSCVLGGGSTKNPKPSPDLLNLAIDTLGIKNQDAIYVGDSSIDYLAAGQAGIPFVLFRGGYDDGVSSIEGVTSVNALDELLALIKTKEQGMRI